MGADRPIGKLERLCRERQARDLVEGPARGLRFDLAAGERVIKFIEGYCKHHKGSWRGKPLILEEWQREIIRAIFGWKRTSDGTRRFRTSYIEIPRKNGKSELAAAVGLYLMTADAEGGAEIYCSATKRDQARIVWDCAKEMVKASPELSRHVRTYRTTLVCERLGSKFEALGADSNTLDGLNPHGSIIDELHAHQDARVWAVLDTALGARAQPLTFAITTAGVYAPDSIGWVQHEYAQKVLEGVFDDDSYYAFIACADEGDDHFAEDTLAKANPNLAVSVYPSFLIKQAEKARRTPSFLNDYLRLHLNVWTQQVTRWLSLDDWNKNDATPLDDAALAGQECYGGLDLSTKLDMTAFALAFNGDDGRLSVLLRYWMPEARIQESARGARRFLSQWADEGWITPTPGDVIDYDFIREEIIRLGQKYRIREIAFDPWNATQIATQLGGGDGFTMVETRQGYKNLSEPAKEFEARVVAKKVRHGGNPVLRWNVANAVIRRDANGNIAPDKENATDKIDGVVACIMALSRANVASTSVYATRGFLTL